MIKVRIVDEDWNVLSNQNLLKMLQKAKKQYRVATSEGKKRLATLIRIIEDMLKDR